MNTNKQLKISKHASEQLKLRWPNWTKSTLTKRIKTNQGFVTDNGSKNYIYIGTGPDIFTGDTDSVRPSIKYRHLFAVVRENANQLVLLTITFKTHNAILKKLKHGELIHAQQVPYKVDHPVQSKFSIAPSINGLLPVVTGRRWLYTTDSKQLVLEVQKI